MSRILGLKKKLLAGLCAFASGAGGASAVTSSVIPGVCGMLELARFTNGYRLGSSVFALPLDGSVIGMSNAMRHLNNGDGTYEEAGYFSTLVFSKLHGGEFRNMAAGVRLGGEKVNFHILMQKSKASDNKWDTIFAFAIETEYVIKRLNELLGDDCKISCDGNDLKVGDGVVKNDRAALNAKDGVLKAALMNIMFKYVLGFDFTFYSSASSGYVPENQLTSGNHPDLAGCWEIFVKVLIKLLDGDGDFNAETALVTRVENIDEFLADRVRIADKFIGSGSLFRNCVNATGDVRGSDYFRAAWHVPAADLPTQQIVQKMTTGQKAGMGILTATTLAGAAGAIQLAKTKLIDIPKTKEGYDEEIGRAESRIRSLSVDASRWKRFEKFKGRSRAAKDIFNAINNPSAGKYKSAPKRMKGGDHNGK